MRAIVPVHELKRRVTEQGRIRMGVKEPVMENGKAKLDRNGKAMTRPKKLNRLRFTSGDRRAMDRIAELYGGTVTPWPEGPTPGLFQCTVDQERIPIVLPPDPLGGTPIYEAWSGGGCLRRCDGVDCTLALADNAGPDAEPAVVPCPCREQDKMLCKPRTRLNVMLRDVPFGGTWRIESTGWNAMEEIPGNVDLILHVQGQGLSQGELSIGQRSRMVNGRMKQFVVPALSLPDSIAQLAEGTMRLNTLGRAPALDLTELPALEAGEETDDGGAWGDDEVVDAEIVHDEHAGEEERSGTAGDTESVAPPPRTRGQSPQAKALHAALNDLMKVPEVVEVLRSIGVAPESMPDAMRHGLIRLVTEGRNESSAFIDPDQAHRAINLIADMLAGDRRFIGFADDGRARVSAHKDATP